MWQFLPIVRLWQRHKDLMGVRPFTATASADEFHAPSPEVKASRRAACLTVS